MAAADGDTTRVLLITANIATCFEQPESMLVAWLDQLLKGVDEHQPGFLALHCQEVGGKNYHSPTNSTNTFLKLLLSRPELQAYTRSLIYLDETTTAADKFTALGNLYFIHKDAGDVKTFNFKERCFVPVEGRQQFTGCIEDIPTKEKAKFPQEFFPECKWSRKGFMRTRWSINGTQMDLINIHLFHDASNFIAMKEFPSVYTLNRRRALHHTLDRFHNDDLENVPFFMFGDFNFRLDTKSVVEILTRDCHITSSPSSRSASDEERRYFLQASADVPAGKPELTVSKRSFRHARHQAVFKDANGEWLRPFDQETSSFSSRLCEMPISFPPSYPFVEEPDVVPPTSPPQPAGGDGGQGDLPPNGGQRQVMSSSSTQDGGEGSVSSAVDLGTRSARLSTTTSPGSGLVIDTANNMAAVLEGSSDANQVFDDYDTASVTTTDTTYGVIVPQGAYGDDCNCAGDDVEEGIRLGSGERGVVGRHYAYTRLPGWCDRVMISTAARKLIAQTEHMGVTYQLLGLDTPMGDHKPVSLLVRFPHSRGVVACCSPPHGPPCLSFVHDPLSGKRCYTAEHPWCLCQHYPTCPAASSKMATTRVNSNKMAAVTSSKQRAATVDSSVGASVTTTKGFDRNDDEGTITGDSVGEASATRLVNDDGKHVPTNDKCIRSRSDVVDAGLVASDGNLAKVPKLESSSSEYLEQNVPNLGALDSESYGSLKPNTECANPELLNNVSSESRTIDDHESGSSQGGGTVPTQGAGLIPNISLTSSCGSERSGSSIVVVRSDQTKRSIVSNEPRVLLPFDVPTIITSCTSDLDVRSSSASDTVSGGLVDVGGVAPGSLPLPPSSSSLSTDVPSLSDARSSSSSGSSFEMVSSSNRSDNDLALNSGWLSPNRSDNDLSLPGSDGGAGTDKRRRLSLLSVDTYDDRGCSSGCGRQCVCSSDETRSRRCSDASFLDFSEGGRKSSSYTAPTGESDVFCAQGTTPQAQQVARGEEEDKNSRTDVTARPAEDAVGQNAQDDDGDVGLGSSPHSQHEAMIARSEQQSVAASETKSVDLSIQSVDSEVSSLLAGDALSTLLRNRFKKYEKSVFDPNSESGLDDLSVTSSMRVEYDSTVEDSTVDLSACDPAEKSTPDGKSLDLSNSRNDASNMLPESSSVVADFDDGHDESAQLITKTPLCDSISGVIDERSGTLATQSSIDCSRKFSGLSISKSIRSHSSRIEDECVSLSLSADLTDDATSANDVTMEPSESNRAPKSDLYTKLELMRKFKRATEPQHSMNNLLVSDSGSEQVSFGVRQPSESSLSAAMYSEGDSVSCRSRKTGGGGPNKDYYESASQVLYTSDDSVSCKSAAGNQPSRDPESASQNMGMYTTSEDSTSYSKSLLSGGGRLPKAGRAAANNRDPESVSQTPTYDIADLESIGRRVVATSVNACDGKGGVRADGTSSKVPSKSKGLRIRRRVLPSEPRTAPDPSASVTGAGDRTSIISGATTASTTSTARPPVKCCCLVS